MQLLNLFTLCLQEQLEIFQLLENRLLGLLLLVVHFFELLFLLLHSLEEDFNFFVLQVLQLHVQRISVYGCKLVLLLHQYPFLVLLVLQLTPQLLDRLLLGFQFLLQMGFLEHHFTQSFLVFS